MAPMATLVGWLSTYLRIVIILGNSSNRGFNVVVHTNNQFWRDTTHMVLGALTKIRRVGRPVAFNYWDSSVSNML